MLIQNLNPAIRYPSPVYHSPFFLCPCRTPHDYFRASTWTICRSLAPSPQIPHQRGGRSPRGGGRRRGRGRAHPQVGPIRSHSGIQYDTQMLSPTSSRRAAEGLQSEFMVDRLEGFNFGRDRYYAFQLSKPVAVRIHDPAVGADRIFECTCAEFRNTLRPCAHVWVRSWAKPIRSIGPCLQVQWLFDGLHAVRSKDEQGAAAPRPTQIELTAQFSELFPFHYRKTGYSTKRAQPIRRRRSRSG